MIDFNNSRLNRRIGVIIQYASLVGIYLLWIATRFWGWSIALAVGQFVMFISGTISHHLIIEKTGIKKLVRTKIANLDERQVVIVLEATRYSFYIFAIICIIIAFLFLLYYENINENPDLKAIIDQPFSIMFFYTILVGMAFWLPSYVIAWREKRV